jgi:hypothetical protein
VHEGADAILQFESPSANTDSLFQVHPPFDILLQLRKELQVEKNSQ